MAKKKTTKLNKKTASSTNKASRAVKKQPKWSIFQTAPVDDRDVLYRKIFWIVFTVIAIVVLMMATQSGVNEDEKFHYPYTEALQSFYSSFGEDTRALKIKVGKMHLYGGFVDSVTGISNKVLGFENTDPGFAIVRHIILGLIGLISLLFTGLLGRQIGGWRAGIIALLILFFSPRFLGHTGINPRDIPFASGYIMSLYFMVRFFGEIPKVSKKTIIGLMAGLALAFATRSGGLLVFAYFGLFALIHMWIAFSDKSINNKGLFLKYLIPGASTALCGYALALAFWPYGLVKPIANVLNSIREFSNYSTVLRMLFKGNMQWSSDIPPANYISTWLFVAMPLLLLIGLIIFLIFSRGSFKKYNRFYLGMVSFVFLFPILYILSKQSNMYTGMRHILFLVPPLAVLAAIGWEYLIQKIERSNKKASWLVIGAFSILSLLPASHIALNFRTCYVYFNELVGGVKGALGYYEMDYWGVSIKRAVDWMEKEGIFEGDEEIIIASNSNFVLQQYTSQYDHVKVRYARFRERYERNWDYAIFINQFIDGGHLRAGDYLDNNVIKVIGKGNSPFSIVYKNPENRPATNGFKALKENKLEEAITLFSQEVASNPKNENAFNGLGQAYFNLRQFAQAEPAFLSAIKLNPESQVGLTYLGLTRLNLGKAAEAMNNFIKLEELNKRDANAIYYQGLILSRSGDTRMALDKLKSVLRVNPGHAQTYQLLVQIYTQQGDQQQANYYQQLMKQYVR